MAGLLPAAEVLAKQPGGLPGGFTGSFLLLWLFVSLKPKTYLQERKSVLFCDVAFQTCVYVFIK